MAQDKGNSLFVAIDAVKKNMGTYERKVEGGILRLIYGHPNVLDFIEEGDVVMRMNWDSYTVIKYKDDEWDEPPRRLALRFGGIVVGYLEDQGFDWYKLRGIDFKLATKG